MQQSTQGSRFSGDSRVGNRAAHRPGRGRKIVVIGGGIGGLATALSFSRQGFVVDVLERRDALSEDGAGIQIGPNGMRILMDLNVDRRLAPYVGKPERIAVMDGVSGERLTELPLGSWIERRHGAPYWVAHRKDLQLALVDAIGEVDGIDIHLGQEAEDVRDDPDGDVSVTTSRGRVFTGRTVFVADGLWSPVRCKIFQQAQPKFSGKAALRAVLPMDDVPKTIRSDETGVWLSPYGHIVHYPVQGGMALAIVVVLKDTSANDEWSTRVHPAWVHHGVKLFPEPARDLIGRVQEWRKWALHELPIPSEFVKNRVALLGDAAHPVLPFLAQGGVLALEDAVVAARCAVEAPTMPDALMAYQAERRPRIARVQAESKRNGEIYHLDGAMAAARNLTLKMMPAGAMMARYDWLYGWRADGQRPKRHWSARLRTG